jgi:oligoendopeptidase F
MGGLYYKSVTDPQIEKDIGTTEQQYKTFVRKYKTSDFTSNPTTLRAALDALYKIEEKLATNRPSRYLRLLASLDSNNDAVTKRLNLVEQRQTKMENTILFFRLDLAKTSTENQKKTTQRANLK